jgi:hypothetical protein
MLKTKELRRLLGWPKEAICAGAIDALAPLTCIPNLTMEWVSSRRMKECMPG